ncbi:MAG: acyl carrier protein [Caldimonas sp.]
MEHRVVFDEKESHSKRASAVRMPSGAAWDNSQRAYVSADRLASRGAATSFIAEAMNTELFDDVVSILRDKFQVDAANLRPDTALESLGLDSLTLMEFVFAVEDQYSVRVPEDKLDPRQSGITLANLVELLDDERRKAASTAAAEAA